MITQQWGMTRMRIDLERYRKKSAAERHAVLIRFGAVLTEGAEIATPQSCTAYAGALTAALVTILRQMTDTLSEIVSGGEKEAGSKRPDPGEIRRAMRRKYFRRLAGISDLKIAEEYVRVHYRYQPPQTTEMTEWLRSFQGRHEAVRDLVCRIDKETDAFIREDIPGMLKLRMRQSAEGSYGKIHI